MPTPMVTKATALIANLMGRDDARGAEALYLKAAIALSSARRETVFEDLTQSLCELLEADGALIGVHQRGARGDGVHVRSLLLDGRWLRDFDYELGGTPCSQVLGKQFCYFGSGVSRRFSHPGLKQFAIDGYAGFPLTNASGESLGLIAIMTHGPLPPRERVEAMLRLFSDRVVVEIERARIEEALKASEELYGAVFKSALDGILMLTLNGEIVDVNPALEKMSGYAREEMIGRRLQDLTNGGELFDQFYRDVFAHGTACSEVETTRKDGTPLHCEFRATVVQFRGATHFLEIVRDITERKRADEQRGVLEDRLRQAQRMEVIGQLTGGIAHDFNNILTGLLGYVDMAEERAEELGDEKLHRYLERAGNAGARARELVQQMLTFSRGKRGSPRTVDLAAITRNTLSLLESMLPSSIVVESALPAELPPTTIDPIHFEQILMNLCINARDAMDGSGHLRIELSQREYSECFCCASCKHAIDGRFVALSISDDGPGITPEVQRRMFEPFYSTKEIGKGTGMGLAIVHGIVHDYGGHLTVSTASGTGTTIRVLLPLEQAEPEAPAEKSRGGALAAEPSLAGHVLLVDDDADVAQYMRDLLERWGLQVSAYADGHAAAAAFALNPGAWQLAVLDQTMPGITGLELARRLRARREDFPIVLYTGYSDALNEEAVRQAGIAALVKKPLDKRNFRRVLGSLLAPREAPVTSG
ncbi:MAG TPA: PAS domain S-box protein [Gammaproteobacteria bacterium]|nr:PAS domain S-box protein [Gammaproteobacteria bacterium]